MKADDLRRINATVLSEQAARHLTPEQALDVARELLAKKFSLRPNQVKVWWEHAVLRVEIPTRFSYADKVTEIGEVVDSVRARVDMTADTDTRELSNGAFIDRIRRLRGK